MKIPFIIVASAIGLLVSPALEAQQLTIVKAVYAGGDVQRDVTATISGKIQGGQVLMNVGNQAFGGDPAFGKSKTLTVVYQTAAGEFTITAREGEKLTLPNPNAILLAPARLQPMSAPKVAQAPAIELPTAPVDIVTTDGRQFKNVTITKLEPDGITLMTDSGLEKIPFTSLSKEIQSKYNYDPQRAAAYAAADAKAQAAMFEANEQELQRQHAAAVADAQKQAAEEKAKADAVKAAQAQQARQAQQIERTFSGEADGIYYPDAHNGSGN